QLLGQRRSARLAGDGHHPALGAKFVGQRRHVTGFAGAVDAFESDEKALLHGNAFPHRAHCPRWYLLTARLCSSRLALKWLLPSPRETKYSASVGAGWTAATSEALPGIAMGVGGNPGRV